MFSDQTKLMRMSKELLKLSEHAQTFVFSAAFIDWPYYNILPEQL